MRTQSLRTPATRPGGSTRVLLAADDSDMREPLARALRAEGYHVIEVAHGPEPSNGPRQPLFQEDFEPPDLVISDVRRPGGSGMDVLAWLGKHDPLLPVILLTARGDEGDDAEPGPPLDVEDLVCAATLLAAPR